MTDPRPSLLSRSWSAVERELSPHVDELVETSQFARAVGLFTGANAFARRRGAAAVGRVWHLLNLPTGTDVARLRRQVGALDREIRGLRIQLEAQAAAAERSPEERGSRPHPGETSDRSEDSNDRK
jgi:hypothetical protein